MACDDDSKQGRQDAITKALDLPEIAGKIFSYLDFNNLYNCSQVCQRWNRIAHDISWKWKKGKKDYEKGGGVDKHCGPKCKCFILPIDMERIDEIKRNWNDNHYCNFYKDVSKIESAARLATAGFIEKLTYMGVTEVDIGGIPVNMMNNLAKVIMKLIYLSGVKGCQLKMFEDVKCERVTLSSMSVDTSNLTQTIRIPSEFSLLMIQGDISQLFDLIETNRMILQKLTLDENATKSLTKMLQDRVMQLSLYYVEMDYKLLTDYDGNGVCQYIHIDSQTSSKVFKYFNDWVSNKRRWKMSRGMKMSREDYSPKNYKN